MNLSANISNENKALVNLMQNDFPLLPEPFKHFAENLGATVDDILNGIKALKNSGIIRRIGPVLDAESLGYKSSLFAVKVPSDKEAESAEYISGFEGVTHNYKRDHEFNIWFTLVASDEEAMNSIIEKIMRRIAPDKMLKLPAISVFKLQAVFGKTRAQERKGVNGQVFKGARAEGLKSVSGQDHKELLKVIQEDLPIEIRPFRVFADRLGITEEDLIKALISAKKNGIIRRYGAILSHTKSGYKVNVMSVFDIPENNIEETGIKMSEKDFVSHCYERERSKEWPYNFYAMVHARTEEEYGHYFEELKLITGDVPFLSLRSLKEYKKSSLRILESPQ